MDTPLSPARAHTCRWAKLAPPPEVRELTDSVVWEKECVGDDEAPAKQLCFLVFLPDILDSKVGQL
jgi:hypothetical protein